VQVESGYTRPPALAAYNAWESAVLRFNGVSPCAKTIACVRRVMALAVPSGF
jgi:hypothetical protein